MFLDGGATSGGGNVVINHLGNDKKLKINTKSSWKQNNPSNNSLSKNNNNNIIKNKTNNVPSFKFKSFQLFNKNNNINNNKNSKFQQSTIPINSIKVGFAKSVNRFVTSVTSHLNGQQESINKQMNLINNKKNNKVSDKQRQTNFATFLDSTKIDNQLRSSDRKLSSIKNRMHPFNRSMCDYYEKKQLPADLLSSNKNNYSDYDYNNANKSTIGRKNLLQRSLSFKQMRTQTKLDINLANIGEKSSLCRLKKRNCDLQNKLNKNPALSAANSNNTTNDQHQTGTLLTRKTNLLVGGNNSITGGSLRLSTLKKNSLLTNTSNSFRCNKQTTANNWLTKTTASIFSIVNIYAVLFILFLAQPFQLQAPTITTVDCAPLPVRKATYGFIVGDQENDNNWKLFDDLQLARDNYIIGLRSDDDNRFNLNENNENEFGKQGAEPQQENDVERFVELKDNQQVNGEVAGAEIVTGINISPESSSSLANNDNNYNDNELLWIQRRRLNRDRALEPAPWFREQPMRRGGMNLLPSPTSGSGSISAPSSIEEASHEGEGSNELVVVENNAKDALDETQVINNTDNNQSEGDSKSSFENNEQVLEREDKNADSSTKFVNENETEIETENRRRGKTFAPILEQLLTELSANDEEFLKDIYNEIKLRRLQQENKSTSLSNDLRRNSRELKISKQQGEGGEEEEPVYLIEEDLDNNQHEVTPLDALKSFVSRKTPSIITINSQSEQSNNNDDSNNISEQTETAINSSLDDDAGDDDGKHNNNRKDVVVVVEGEQEPRKEEETNGVGVYYLKDGNVLDGLYLNDKTELREKENNEKGESINSGNLMKRSKSKVVDGEGEFYQIISLPEQSQQQASSTDNNNDNPSLDLTTEADGLALIATRIKSFIEDKLGLSRGTILGLYPMSYEKLLIKLNIERLNKFELINMIENYDYARGYIVMSWPKESKQNPLPLLTAITRTWSSQNLDSSSWQAESNILSNDILNDLENGEESFQTKVSPSSTKEQMAMFLKQPEVSLEEQFSELELIQSMLAGPEALRLTNNNNNDNNDDDEKLKTQTGDILINDDSVDVISNDIDLAQREQTRYNALDENQSQANSDGLKYTRSVGRADDLKLPSSNRYNIEQPREESAVVSNRLKSKQLKDSLLLDRLLMANYLNALYDDDSNFNVAEMLPKGTITTTSGLFSSLRNNAMLMNGLVSNKESNGASFERLSSQHQQQQGALKQQKHEQEEGEGEDKSSFDYWTNKIYNNNHTVHLFALMAAILGACLAVKLLILKGGSTHTAGSPSPSSSGGSPGANRRGLLFRRNFSRFGHYNGSGSSFRSLWSSDRSQSILSGQLDGSGETRNEKGPNKANLSSNSSCCEDSLLHNQKECDDIVDDDITLTSSSKQHKLGPTKSLDILTQKLICLLKSQINYQQEKASPASGITIVNKEAEGANSNNNKMNDKRMKLEEGACYDDNDKNKIIEVDSVSNNFSCDSCQFCETTTSKEHVHNCSNEQHGHFRSSRSYIKSLIDVLSQAKSHMPNVVPQFGSALNQTKSSLCNDDDNEDDGELVLANNKIQQQTNSSTSPTNANKENQLDDETGIVMSQMDISAAHLILAYMEKHLEDKERLKREWLELNSIQQQQSSINNNNNNNDNKQSSASTSSSSSSTINENVLYTKQKTTSEGNKIRQLVLQRLAKVALNDENKTKNRNPLVVPFDRNRVKLFGASSSNASSCTSPTYSTLSSSSLASSQQALIHAGSKNNSKLIISGKNNKNKQIVRRRSDYINASYIYDDDPRRPTHIIAQGPTEQTTAQFWQMIWEQGVSVIVMLTRLNENSHPMCHCYWPTNVVQLSQTSASIDTSASTAKQPLDVPFVLDLATAAKSTTTTTTNTNTHTSTTIANGRKGSVTSVFNGPALRLVNGNGTNNSSNSNGNPNNTLANNTTNPNSSGQPTIIANGESTNNVLIFDISCNNSFEEEVADNFKTNDKPDSNIVNRANNNGRIRLELHLVSEHVSSNDYLVRNMYMINRSTGETRTITQFHYLSWPLNGVPDNAKSLLSFRRKVHKSYRNLKSPILVHCSDGAGRSGTYTLIDIILERIKNGAKEIDPRATLEHLRDQRIGLCSTQSQFEFVLVALAEEIQLILNALPQ